VAAGERGGAPGGGRGAARHRRGDRGSRARAGGHRRLANEALAFGQRGQAENALHYYAQALFNIRREQGRLAEVEDAVRRFVELYPAIPAWKGALALVHVELGRADEARAEFEAVARAGFEDLPRDANWLIAVTLLAEVCGALGDADRARELYEMLRPYAGRNVVVGRGSTCNGSASRLLGILAATMGEWDVAEGHFADALAMHERIGARPLTARTQLARAEMLLTRRAAGDEACAREELASAIASADEIGMPSLAERAKALAPAERARA
jgi:tetratricopeptide (TPR) repeat protein